MERKQVDSSNILSLGYSKKERMLEVEFKAGTVYRYFNVNKELYEQMLKAESVGKYFHINIKGKYDFKKVGE